MGSTCRPLALVVMIYLLRSVAHPLMARDLSLEELKSMAVHASPETVVTYGLPHDRGWVLQELLWQIESSPLTGNPITALRYIEQYGDEVWVSALERLQLRMANRDRAEAVREASIALRGRLFKAPDEKYAYWVKQLDDPSAPVVESALDALGDLGDQRAIPVLAKLSVEASSPPRGFDDASVEARSRHRHRFGKHTIARIRAAFEKIHRLNRKPRFEALREAALGTPIPDCIDPQQLTCLVKTWGIAGLAKLKTPEALNVLVAMFEDYDRQYATLLKSTGGDRSRAHDLADDTLLTDYICAVHRALKQAGRDVAAERPIAAGELLFPGR